MLINTPRPRVVVTDLLVLVQRSDLFSIYCYCCFLSFSPYSISFSTSTTMSSPPSSTSPPPGLTTKNAAATASTTPEGQDEEDQQQQQEPSPPPSSPPHSPSASRPASPDLPLTMTASLVLAQLPRDATAALAEAHAHAEQILGGLPPSQKIVVRFKAVGSAPPLPAKRLALSRVGAGQRFEAVVAYLRRVLKVRPGEGVCLYVNNCFAPALDEVVGNLWRVRNLLPQAAVGARKRKGAG